MGSERSPAAEKQHQQQLQPTNIKRRRRKKTWMGCLPISCGDVGFGRKGDSSWLPWKKLGKTKRTVPVDTSPVAVVEKEGVEGEKQAKVQKLEAVLEGSKQGFLDRLFPKEKEKKTGRSGTRLLPKKSDRVQLSPKPSNSSTRLPPFSPKYDTRHGPVQISSTEQDVDPNLRSSAGPKPKVAPPAAGSSTVCSISTTQCRKPVKPAETSSEREGERTGQLDSRVAGLSVLMVTVLILMLGGRACAIICTCAWFYLAPRMRGSVSRAGGGDPQGKKEAVEMDFDSEEYKKKVILQGLLERNGRFPAG